MKKVIAELDRIAKYLETYDEPWAINLAYRIDIITQKIEDESDETRVLNVSKNVLESYKESIDFLSSHEEKLKELIKDQNTRNPIQVYKIIKNHFGNLKKEECIRFIKSVINNIDK